MTSLHTLRRRITCVSLSVLALAACSDETEPADTFLGGDATTGVGPTGAGGGASSGTGGAGQGGAGGGGGGTTGSGGQPLPSSVEVRLVPAEGVAGTQRVSFAIPLQPGQLSDAARVRVLHGGAEVPSASRGLATHGDGSVRSVQVQLDLEVAGDDGVVVEIDATPPAATIDLVPVEDTLVSPDGESGPRVWALLPAAWLSGSGVAGPQLPEADVVAPEEAHWATLCDYAAWGTDVFLEQSPDSDRAVWLYDRGTAFYRGYARRGDLVPLASAYRETSMYRNRITGSGTSARNGVPAGASSDTKYQYAQNLAIHYLLTGDDRFREAAEDMALGMTELWPDPQYAGGDDMWTERNAGFSLLAYVWALQVTDDQAAPLAAAADEAVLAYLDVQDTYPVGYDDPDARCFAHHGDAHDPEEGNAYFGCSPWMSAILADGLDGYAREKGGDEAVRVREALVKLGRILAREGRDASDNPFYWMGVDTDVDAPDDYTEHVGESAYVVAMALHHQGGTDPELVQASSALLAKFASDGVAGQLRSFNWQCRSAVATPFYLAQ